MKIFMGIVFSASSTLAFVFLVGCTFVTMLAIQHPTTMSDYLQSVFFYGAIFVWGSSFFVIPAIAILSVPLHRLAIRFGYLRGRYYAIVGAIVGEAVCLAVQIASAAQLSGLEFPGQMDTIALIIAPLLGAIAGLGFWVGTRPDKAALESDDLR